MNYEDDRNQDAAIDYYRKKAAEIEQAISLIALTIELSVAASELEVQPAWKKLLERIKDAEDQELRRLRNLKLDAYDLGRRQGHLAALSLVTNSKQLTEQELAVLRDRAKILSDQLTECRRLSD